ncbi:MAG: hypothetical protein ATN35_03010 [Epulopiscium sp. Nele67-Bin004]|nr:MAG: hypothetical protein ATN35_03010 [Epulopiscium sp. Nele67-Bin004]
MIILIAILSFIILPAHIFANTVPIKRTELLMGTVVNISVFDERHVDAVSDAFDRLTELDDLLSINKEDTLISYVNSCSGERPVAVPTDIYKLIDKSLYYSRITDGLFDVTIAPLTNLWRIGFEDAQVPDADAIEQTLPLIGYENILLEQVQSTVFLTKENMALDLGSIAKGYACDEVARILDKQGVKKALIDIGGNVYVIGSSKVGLQHPFQDRGIPFAALNLTNKSVVTSGIYERFLEVDGVMYHHLLNPDTGYPFENELASVTIISNISTDGDALSTGVFAKGLEDGMAFVENINGIEAIFVTTDYKIYISSGIGHDFEVVDPQFALYSNH